MDDDGGILQTGERDDLRIAGREEVRLADGGEVVLPALAERGVAHGTGAVGPDVERLAHDAEIDGAVGEHIENARRAALMENKFHVRKALLEHKDLVRQYAVADRGDRPEVDGVTLLLARRLHEQQRFIYLVHDLVGALAQKDALGRDDHVFLITDEKLAAELLLQTLELQTQRRLGNAQGVGGFGDAAVFGDGKKVFELLECHTGHFLFAYRYYMHII